jgi:4-hydroxybenzoate polyprenyltransferase
VEALTESIAQKAGNTAKPSLRGHIQLARIDHWVKNVFVLPGMIVPLSLSRDSWSHLDPVKILIGFAAISLVTSSNYVLNEVLDGPYDLQHPVKCDRPVPSGRVSIPFAYVQWIVMMVAGLALSWQVSVPFAATLLALWVMGCVYNIPPVRSKDLPYVDVLSEAVNNPLRMLAGWYLTGVPAVPPTSLLISYWMVGCYFMALKRFAEFRGIGDPSRSAAYRKSFAYYSEQRLLVSITFYAAHSMLFLGAFIVRYRLELILAFPLVALVMAYYLALAFKPESAVQRPEALYKEQGLMTAVIACAVAMLLLLFIDVPILHRIFAPTVF